MQDLTIIQSYVESNDPYPVPFEEFWQWVGYSTKQNAERTLMKNFVKDKDFNFIILDKVQNEGGRQVQRNIQTYLLTIDCAKSFAMLAQTAVGKEVRLYFIDCETKLKAVQASANFLPEELMTTINELIDDKMQHFATKQELKKLDQQTDKLVTDVIGSFYDWLNDNVFQAIEERLNKLEGKFQNLSIEKLKELVLCYVYFLREGDSDNFKVGISIGTKIRIQNLSVGNSKKLTAVWQIPFKNTDAAKACEDFLKVFFFEKKIRGEWFKLDYQDFEFIQQLTEIHTTHLENTLG